MCCTLSALSQTHTHGMECDACARATRYALVTGIGLRESSRKQHQQHQQKKKKYDKLGNKVDWLAEQKSFIWRWFGLDAATAAAAVAAATIIANPRTLTRQFIIPQFYILSKWKSICCRSSHPMCLCVSECEWAGASLHTRDWSVPSTIVPIHMRVNRYASMHSNL